MTDPRIESLIQNETVQKIFSVLAASGYEARFVGGCVRDALIGRDFSEIDLATTATPEQMVECFKDNNIRTIPTGLSHGTITALLDGQCFEITTLRKDVETDGRHAVVDFTSDWVEDAKRRDLTINAMSAGQYGCLHDYCGGLEDIQQKKLRFIGDAAKRIEEDYLRILRFFRFASVLDWEITDKETLGICSGLAPNLKQLSRERIQVELYKTLLGPGCLRVISVMEEHGILSPLIDRLDTTELLKTIVHEDKWREQDGFRRLLALTGTDIDKLETFVTLSRDNKKRVENINKIGSERSSLVSLLYFYGQQAVKDYYFLYHPEWDFSIIDKWEKPVLPLKAEDIFSITNGPGPQVGKLLSQAETYWVERNFKPSKQDLLELLQSN